MTADPTTPEGRADLRVLIDAASSPPWVADAETWDIDPGWLMGILEAANGFEEELEAIRDLRLIVAAVNALPAALDAIDRCFDLADDLDAEARRVLGHGFTEDAVAARVRAALRGEGS